MATRDSHVRLSDLAFSAMDNFSRRGQRETDLFQCVFAKDVSKRSAINRVACNVIANSNPTNGQFPRRATELGEAVSDRLP